MFTKYERMFNEDLRDIVTELTEQRKEIIKQLQDLDKRINETKQLAKGSEKTTHTKELRNRILRHEITIYPDITPYKRKRNNKHKNRNRYKKQKREYIPSKIPIPLKKLRLEQPEITIKTEPIENIKIKIEPDLDF
jgi:predicted metal-dependent hydrolase